MAYRVGRYQVHEPIASGGMAVVHLGRIVGPVGFSRTIAIKRLHPHLATDPEFVARFLDEARLAARVQHPNVVATLDVVASHGQLFLVMDFVLGASLAQLASSAHGRPPPPAVVSAVVAGALYGLQAAHEARDEHGESLGIVHRDVSPQNLLVGVDGLTRVVDFGVAKAAARMQSTRSGQLLGKLAYMAPEQILRRSVDRRADVYAAGVVLWEALTLRRLFQEDDERAVIAAVLEGRVPPPSTVRADLPVAVDAVVARALAADPGARFATAQDFAAALESAITPAPQREVGAWVESTGHEDLRARRGLVSEVERSPSIEGPTDDDAVEGLVSHALSPEEARKLATALTTSLPSRWDAPQGASAAIAPPAQRRSRRMWIAGAIGAAAVTGGAIAASARSSPPAAPVPSVSAALARPAMATPSAAPSASLAPSAPALPPDAPSSGAAPRPSSPAVAHAPPAHRVGPPPRASTPSGAGAPPANSKSASCDPPFSIDATGVKRFKPWCI
ncbi:MAG TPA: protein kinase [Polyangiaceae bacterium]|jgi:serine/threonine-protein kinase|nr:protein kinase [Polyangiaceae bacterium]